MSHIYHPDVHEHGLADGCRGCDEIAANPFAGGDEAMIRRWIRSATARPRVIPDGELEALAVVAVLNTLERVGRLAECAPDLVAAYLDRWGLDATLEARQPKR